MKNKHLFSVAASLAFAAFLAQASPLHQIASPVIQAQPVAHAATGYVSGISDGDTFYISIEGRSTRVRLAQIDAPEKAQPFGQRAEQALRELIWKQDVTVTWREADVYGRPIVQVEAAGVNVNAEMVNRGFAWVYRRYATDKNLYVLERAAQQDKRGLWADMQPIEPWEWRKTHPKSGR